MGVSWLDVVVSLLKFEGFTTDTFWSKVKRIVTYPLVLMVTVLFVIWFVFGMIMVTFKKQVTSHFEEDQTNYVH